MGWENGDTGCWIDRHVTVAQSVLTSRCRPDIISFAVARLVRDIELKQFSLKAGQAAVLQQLLRLYGDRLALNNTSQAASIAALRLRLATSTGNEEDPQEIFHCYNLVEGALATLPGTMTPIMNIHLKGTPAPNTLAAGLRLMRSQISTHPEVVMKTCCYLAKHPSMQFKKTQELFATVGLEIASTIQILSHLRLAERACHFVINYSDDMVGRDRAWKIIDEIILDQHQERAAGISISFRDLIFDQKTGFTR